MLYIFNIGVWSRFAPMHTCARHVAWLRHVLMCLVAVLEAFVVKHIGVLTSLHTCCQSHAMPTKTMPHAAHMPCTLMHGCKPTPHTKINKRT